MVTRHSLAGRGSAPIGGGRISHVPGRVGMTGRDPSLAAIPNPCTIAVPADASRATLPPTRPPTEPREVDRSGHPANVVVVLLDSLNRHHLGCYGGDEFATPNLDRFARERAVRFTRHVTGSLPCMPARHDILCGALDFLWKPWGSIELWEQPLTRALDRAGVTSMLVTDHPHLFETGGENYHTDFFGWDYLRGHEDDPWRTRPDPSWIGTPARPGHDRRLVVAAGLGDGARRATGRGYDRARTWFRTEEDYPGPKTMAAAARWLRDEAPAARPVPAVRRRVRPPRAVRHPRALARPLRGRALGGRPAHLAALRRRGHRRRGSSPSARAGTSGPTTAPSCR